MKNFKKIAIFLIVALLIFSVLPITVFAEAANTTGEVENNGKLDMNLKPDSFAERGELALQGTVTGMLMIFAVLTLLCLILYGSKFVFYDLPNIKREKKIAAKKAELKACAEEFASVIENVSEEVVAEQNDGELAAVITAAIAAMLDSEEYKNEFVGSFRVVSFKRSTQGAWNRK